MRSRSYAIVLVLSALLGGGAMAQPVSAAPAMVAWYGFDGTSGTIRDDSGNGHTMHLYSGRGGRIRLIGHGAGQAMQFPVKCRGARCPHAVLQSPHTPELNPGTTGLAFGATVRLRRSQTSKGQNVVQKGYSITGSQYKLQIDGSAGRPSCVLVDIRKDLRQVWSSVPVADGAWHTVRCQRLGAALRIMVDGAVTGLTKIPAGLSVANNHPLSIGGKGAYADNDQFQGSLDDVFVRIG
jgi:hypothetical protein